MPLNEAQQQLVNAQTWMKNIQTKGQQLGGIVTCRFSQSLEPVMSFCKQHSDAAAGICHALTTQWILFHANDDSLWNELYTEVKGASTTIQAIRIDKMRSLVNAHVAGLYTKGWFGRTVRAATGNNQWAHTDIELAKHGIIPRGQITDNAYLQSSRSKTGNPGAECGRAVYTTMKQYYGDGAYAFIYVGGGGSAHYVCAHYVTDSKGVFKEVTFFDPNFGEYFFDGASADENFKKFLDYLFTDFYKKYDICRIRSYAKKVKFAKAKKRGWFW